MTARKAAPRTEPRTDWFSPIGAPARMEADNRTDAREEAHHRFGYHVLDGPAPRFSVLAGSPHASRRVAWCVRGRRKAVVLEIWNVYWFQTFETVAVAGDVAVNGEGPA